MFSSLVGGVGDDGERFDKSLGTELPARARERRLRDALTRKINLVTHRFMIFQEQGQMSRAFLSFLLILMGQLADPR